MKSIALIGYGYWGKKLFKYLAASSDFQVKYIYFRSLATLSAQDIEKEIGHLAEPSLEKILQDPQLDAVLVATPMETHYDLVEQALLAGKHVLSEKPLTLDTDQAHALADLAYKQECQLVTDYTHTFSQALRHAAELVQEGRIGGLKRIEIDWLQHGRFTGHDVYALIGSHALSIVDMFIPLKHLIIDSQPVRYKDGLVTEAKISLTSGGGNVDGKISLSLHHPEKKRSVKIIGERGICVYGPLEMPTLILGCMDKGGISVEESFDFDESHNIVLALKYFFDVLEEKEKSNIDSSLKITEIISACSREKTDAKT